MAQFLIFNDLDGFPVILATDRLSSIRALLIGGVPGIEIISKDGRQWQSTTYDVEGAAEALGLEVPE